MPDLSSLSYVTLSFHSTTIHTADLEHTAWTISASVPDDNDDEPSPIFWMDGFTFALGGRGDLAAELDAVDADTEVFTPLVRGNELADDLDLYATGSQLILINRVTLASEWRHLGGVGRYLTGCAIRLLRPGAECIALHTAPFELRAQFEPADVPDAEWQAGEAALGTLWTTLGFTQFNGNLYVLDPGSVALDEALGHLQSRLGIR